MRDRGFMADRDIEAMVDRLRASVGEFIFDDSVKSAPPRERESWVELQGLVVALANDAPSDERHSLAVALLEAVIGQHSFGTTNPLTRPAFLLIIDAAGDELTQFFSGISDFGGRRYLHWHIWTTSGPIGTRWFATLAGLDPLGTQLMFEDVVNDRIPGWEAKDWSDRLDVIANLPYYLVHPYLHLLGSAHIPRHACPGLVRVVLAHAADHRDSFLRGVCGYVRALKSDTPGDVELFEWHPNKDRRELLRWILEFTGAVGERDRLVSTALEIGTIDREAAEFLSAPIERPVWIDHRVPWTVTSVIEAGVVDLPDGRLSAAGDPWATPEGLPWIAQLPIGNYPVRLVLASHPLSPDERNAALHLIVRNDAVTRWTLVSTDGPDNGYYSETGLAGLGSVDAYELLAHDEARCYQLADEGLTVRSKAEAIGSHTIVMCEAPRHRNFRTWLGLNTDNEIVAVVTDLHLLHVDLEIDAGLPWDDPSRPQTRV
jgi:hypothetical protein